MGNVMGAASEARLEQLWVFPVKGCQGIRYDEWPLSPTGLLYDRQWCIVDADGTRYPKNEYLSGRKLPRLAGIGVAFVGKAPGDGMQLVLTAEGMTPLEVPVQPEAYQEGEEVGVYCGGRSTTDPKATSWELGIMKARSAGRRAEEWLTEVLNREDFEVDPLRRKLPKSRFLLVRAMPTDMRAVTTYAGPNATKGIGGQSLAHVPARDGDGVAFQDWSPFLLTSLSSAADLARRMGSSSYPVLSARGSIVVDGAPAWDEEEWLDFSIGPIAFRKLKECPRCSVPNRDQTTGSFLLEAGSYLGAVGTKYLPMATLRRAFPQKADDDEWGIWKGPFFGVYVGHDSAQGVLRRGMPVRVQRSRRGLVVKRRVRLLLPLLMLLALVLFRRRKLGLAAAAALAALACGIPALE
eukprot:Hpha_TRINITY_DN14371_c0_g1::TRINITY_DN14371_c0_g1_i1::g.87178::m.87178